MKGFLSPPLAGAIARQAAAGPPVPPLHPAALHAPHRAAGCAAASGVECE